ncbi:MAG: cohesin domain-containing protein [Clostridia bacterium]|nr:cohesin domain-containing protein [Clostridia bacterium]
MRRFVRTVCALFACVIVLAHLCVFAGAANGEAAVMLDTVSAMPGQRVTVNMTLTKNPGITGLRFFVYYDNSKLTLESAEYTNIGGGGLVDINTENDPVVLLWNVGTYEFTETGVLCTFSFKIKEGAQSGTVPLSVTYERGDCIDLELKNLAMDITDGAVNILYDSTDCSHENTEQVTLEPSTCVKQGKYEVRCKTCSNVVASGLLPLSSHEYGPLVVKKAPTFTQTGQKEQTCGVCGKVRTEEIPVLEEANTDTVAVSTQDTGTADSVSADSTHESENAVPIETAVATGDNTTLLIIALAVAAALIVLLVLLKNKR